MNDNYGWRGETAHGNSKGAGYRRVFSVYIVYIRSMTKRDVWPFRRLRRRSAEGREFGLRGEEVQSILNQRPSPGDNRRRGVAKKARVR